jgi:pimeloyl-ACP methyl ester carboxylesterase
LESFEIQGSSGLTITFDLDRCSLENAPLIIFLHGFKGFKDWGQWPVLGKEMSQMGMSVLRMNFSHNGTTSKTPIDFTNLEAFGKNTFSKEIEDVKKVVEWISNNDALTDTNIHIMAHSRGGAIGLIALNEIPNIKSLVTLSGVGNLVRFSESELAYWKQNGIIYAENGRTNQQMPLRYSLAEDFLLNEKRFAPMEVVKSITKPYLIIHAEKDETVLLTEAKKLAENGKTAILKIISGANHSFGGMHPYSGKKLPKDTETAMDMTINFIKNIEQLH